MFQNSCYSPLAASKVQPWLDEEDLIPGQAWERVIPNAVRESHIVLVCLSVNSINKEGYVQKEIRYAVDIAEEKPDGVIYLIPVLLQECQIPDRFKHLHCARLYENRGYSKLLNSLTVRANEVGVDVPIEE